MEDMENRVVRLEEKTHNIDVVVTNLSERFIRHMDKEEASFNQLYKNLRNIDKELQEAFRKRDDAINELDKRIVKILAYATAAFTGITMLIQVAVRVI